MPKAIRVLAKDGNPLMPTTRRGKVKRMLKNGEARIADLEPFTIQLLYDSGTEVQPLCLSLDGGRKNIGSSVINTKGECLFSTVVQTRNDKVKKLMDARRAYRRASRMGERKARQRLAKKHHSMFEAGVWMRKLPGCEELVTCHYIRNTQARFMNRTRPAGWLTPTANQLLETHQNLVTLICKYYPITDIAFELNRFTFMKMENPETSGLDFQNGPLKGFRNVDEAVYADQRGVCLLCGKNHIERYHHIVPRSEGGDDTFSNKAGVCSKCHERVHNDLKAVKELRKKKAGRMKRFAGTSVLNQIIPAFSKWLLDKFGDHVHFVEGWQTSQMRQNLEVKKDRFVNPCHDLDAYLIGCRAYGVTPTEVPKVHTYLIKQYRRRDRARIYAQRERIYKLDGKKVATNRRKRTHQFDNSLHDYYLKMKNLHGKAEAKRICSSLEVTKSVRYMNNLNRILPGAIFWYEGKRYVLSGQENKGNYYKAYNCSQRFPSKKCTIAKRNTGLVFVG